MKKNFKVNGQDVEHVKHLLEKDSLFYILTPQNININCKYAYSPNQYKWELYGSSRHQKGCRESTYRYEDCESRLKISSTIAAKIDFNVYREHRRTEDWLIRLTYFVDALTTDCVIGVCAFILGISRYPCAPVPEACCSTYQWLTGMAANMQV